MSEPKVICEPDVVGGTPVFAGARVAVRMLFEHLKAGDSLAVFLSDFPAISREQPIDVIEAACVEVAPDAHPA